jgi:hypothetical protein
MRGARACTSRESDGASDADPNAPFPTSSCGEARILDSYQTQPAVDRRTVRTVLNSQEAPAWGVLTGQLTFLLVVAGEGFEPSKARPAVYRGMYALR